VKDHAPAAPAAASAPSGADDDRVDGGSSAEAASGQDSATAIPAGFGLAVISGLADDVRVSSTSSGVSVRMSWPSSAAAD
jgi:hypothetical protein